MGSGHDSNVEKKSILYNIKQYIIKKKYHLICIIYMMIRRKE